MALPERQKGVEERSERERREGVEQSMGEGEGRAGVGGRGLR